MTRNLSPSLVSLIHHVELNQSGWWNRAIQEVVLNALFEIDSPASAVQVVRFAAETWGITIGALQTEEMLGQLLQQNLLIESDGTFKVSEKERRRIEEERTAIAALEEYVSQRFTSLATAAFGTDQAAQSWSAFKQDCLIPMIVEMGARTYTIVTSSPDHLVKTRAASDYLQGVSGESREKLLQAVTEFFDVSDARVREYVLRHLNAYFFNEASALSQDVLGRLEHLTAEKPTFRIFVDTNFVFSLLSLHKNPSDEASETLLSLVEQAAPYVDIRFYILPDTLEETRRAIQARREQVNNIRWSLSLASGTLATSHTGIFRDYLQAYQQSGGTLTPDMYFDLLEQNLIDILRRHSIEESAVDLRDYSMRQDVVDDILGQQEHEKHHNIRYPKSYAGHRHDMVLWHYVLDQRPNRVEDFSTAKYWIVTIDFRLLGFDRFKSRVSKCLPVCMHPSNLVQVLQFWVPRTEGLESAIVGSLKLPFAMRQFDVEAERTTLAIVQSLSAYEGVENLPEEVVAAVLSSKALQRRFQDSPSGEKRIALIRDELVLQLESSQREVVENRLRAAELERAIRDKAHYIDGQAAAIEKRNQRLRELEAAKGKSDATNVKLERRVERLEATIAAGVVQDDYSERYERLRCYLLAFVIPMPLVIAAAFAAFLLASTSISQVILARAVAVFAVGLIAAVYALAIRVAAKGKPAWRATLLVRAMDAWWKIAVWLIGGVLVSLAASMLWEVLGPLWKQYLERIR